MKKFMNLLNDELKRAKWPYLILVIAVILTQSLVIFRQFRQANEKIKSKEVNVDKTLEVHWHHNLKSI